MAGLYEKPSETYAKKRPRFPKEWFSMIASLTAGHHRAGPISAGLQLAATVQDPSAHVRSWPQRR